MIGTIVKETVRNCYIKYIFGLLICRTRKTCTQMAEATGIGHDVLSRALKSISKSEGIQEGLIQAAKALLNPNKKHWLILDDSMILKPHAKTLQNRVLDHCGATGKIEKGLVAIFICITDGEIVIPLGFRFWTSRKLVANPADYRKKWEIGLSLITELDNKIPCKNLLMDGAYANRYFLQMLTNLGFEYEARFRKNGVLVAHGIKKSVGEMLDPLLIGPFLYRTVQASWQGLDVSVTAHKHRNTSGDKITYTISNRLTTASQHAKDYRIRWGIEMFFRTAKQSLGLQHCASANLDLQRAHINACITAYIFLQQQRLISRHSSVEEALHSFRHTYSYHSSLLKPSITHLIHAFA